MKPILALTLMASLCAMAEAPKRSGKATAQWVTSDSAVEAGGSFKTVIRLQLDDHWHSYWINPGEAGMETSAEVTLPEGWKSSGLLHPIPKRFETGGLHGFGHEGTVDYALELFAPENFKGNAEFKAKIEWLSCNDDACVPGEMTLSLKLADGKAAGSEVDPAAIATAYGKLPVRAAQNVKMSFEDGKDHWKISIKNFDAYKLDPAKTKVLVATPELVPATAEPKIAKEGDLWVSQLPKGEFAPKKPDSCAVLLVEEGKRAVMVEWNR